MPKDDINFLPKDIKNENPKKTSTGKPFKEKNTNDNKKISKIDEKPDKKSKWL